MRNCLGRLRTTLLDQSKTKTQQGNSKSCSSMSSGWGLIFKYLRCLCPSSFVACSTYLSLHLTLLPESSSPWQMPHGSVTFSFSTTLRLHFHNFIQWPLKASLQGLYCHTLPGSSGSLKPWRKNPQSLCSCNFHVSRTSTTWSILPSSAANLGWTFAL